MTEHYDLPTSNRPETPEDLPEYQTDPREILRITSLTDFAAAPDALRAISDLIAAVGSYAEGTFAIDIDSNSVRIGKPHTAKELDKMVEEAQASYDRGMRYYGEWLETGKVPQYRYEMDKYLRAVGEDPEVVTAPKCGADGCDYVAVDRADLREHQGINHA